MKHLYPETYTHIYRLVSDGVDERTVPEIDKRIIVTELSKEIDPTLFYEELTEKEMHAMLCQESFLLANQSERARMQYEEWKIELFYQKVKSTIMSIFEAAEEELHYERGGKSDEYDWRLQDNSERHKDLTTHFYR